jgi:hypothetical protein
VVEEAVVGESGEVVRRAISAARRASRRFSMKDDVVLPKISSRPRSRSVN